MLAHLALSLLLAPQGLAECRLEERAVIPALTDTSFIIGRTAAIAVDRHGRLYVADQNGPEGAIIHIVDAKGHRQASVGRHGSGPGEYRGLDGGLLFLNDDRLVVRDAGNGRYVVFPIDDRPAAHWGLRPTYGFTPLLLDAGGLVSIVAFRPGEGGFGRSGGQVLVRIGNDGRVRDTLKIPQPDVPEAVAVMQSSGGINRIPVPFAPRALWSWRPSRGFIVARSDSAWVEAHENGRATRVALPELVRQPFGAGERDAVEEQLRRSSQGGRIIGGARIPETKPYVRALWAAPDDRTWVLHHTTGVPRAEEDNQGRPVTRWTERLRLTILDPSGTPTHRINGPAVRYDQRITPGIRGDTLWLAVTDDAGIPRVMRYEIACGEG